MSNGPVPPPEPVAPLSPPAYASPPAKSPSSKKLVWIIVTVLGGMAVLAMLFVGAVVLGVFRTLKSSTPYQHAVQVATHDPRVLAKLGAPVKPAWMLGGSIDTSGNSGSADLTVGLEGALHKGQLYVAAKKTEGEWSYETLAVRVEGGEGRIDLLRPAGASPEEK